VRASRVSGTLGARVALAEPGPLGGTCVNVGCIPKKLLAYAAHFPDELEDAAAFGWSVPPARFDWPTLLANKDREVLRLNGVYERMLVNAGVRILRERALVRGPHQVEIGGRTVTARYLLVATGSSPQVPDIPGKELAFTSNEAFHLERLPRSALVVGGGYIAVEFASIFCGLGVQTTLAYRGGRLLRGFDAELGERLAVEMAKKRVSIRLEANLTRIDRKNGALEVSYADGTRQQVDAVMFATGRRPNSADLGLEAAGVKRILLTPPNPIYDQVMTAWGERVIPACGD